MTVKIITQSRVKELLNCCKDTGIVTWKKVCTKNKVKVGDEAGSFHNKGYRTIMVDGKHYYTHRILWFYTHGTWPDELDHINGNGLDNRLCNLREVTHAQNCQNKKKQVTNSSGITGICWHSRDSVWIARIMVNGKAILLGSFKNKFDAMSARKSAEIKYNFHPNHGR